ncbi:AraC family transcriptional regulator [Paenibacillus sinopodophylli]|uniref:AraC family transcriptional regulator n=1 Tax=Paenibacillus sinopodophylli TaxID=1837342 RepID=UPI00110C9C73|nr:AraC family transcriptional regulator [Paenibacillus sinopodophylli]
MSRLVNPVPELVEQNFLFFNRLETREGHLEIVNAHQGIEIVLVLEGHGQLILDQKVHAVGPGTLVFIQPFQLHHFKMKPPYVRTPIVFDPYLFDRYAALFPTLHAFFQRIWKGKLERQLFSLTEEEILYFDALSEQFEQRLSGVPKHERQEELLLFLIDFMRALRKMYEKASKYEQAEVVDKREGRHIEHMMSWIEEHYQEEFSLEKLAESLHVSPFYASHLFSEETGCTLSQYIIARRLRESCLLLTVTDRPVVQIGMQTGFNSSAYFCKTFKKKMGLSPQAFRKRSRQV